MPDTIPFLIIHLSSTRYCFSKGVILIKIVALLLIGHICISIEAPFDLFYLFKYTVWHVKRYLCILIVYVHYPTDCHTWLDR